MKLPLRAIAILWVAACGGGGGAAPLPVAPKLEAVDPRKAASDAKGLITEIYESLGHGDTDSLQTLLAPQLTVFGPRRGDVVGKREDAIVALGKLVDLKAKKHTPLRSSTLEVRPSPGGHSAWAFDVVNIGPDPLVVLAVLSNADDIWLVDAAGLANTPSVTDIKRELHQDAIVPPGASGLARLDPNAQAAVEKFTRGLADQTVWGSDLESHDEAVVIGPAAGEVSRGKKDIAKLWKKRLELNTREIGVNQTAAGVTRDGQLAWVSTVATRAADGDDPTPLRVFAVYARDGAVWTMRALHESLAVDQPGTGTAFKKIVPPPPPPKIEKPVVAVTPPPATTKKKKKSKPELEVSKTDEPPKKLKKAPEVVDDVLPPEKKKKKKKKKKPVDDEASRTDDAPQKVEKAPDATDDAPPPKKKKTKKKKKKPVDDDDVKVDDDKS